MVGQPPLERHIGVRIPGGQPKFSPPPHPSDKLRLLPRPATLTCMAHNFGSILFTPAVQALQERHGSRRQYARFADSASRDHLSADEREFLSTRDSFYIASVASNGWPYVQH